MECPSIAVEKMFLGLSCVSTTRVGTGRGQRATFVKSPSPHSSKEPPQSLAPQKGYSISLTI